MAYKFLYRLGMTLLCHAQCMRLGLGRTVYEPQTSHYNYSPGILSIIDSIRRDDLDAS